MGEPLPEPRIRVRSSLTVLSNIGKIDTLFRNYSDNTSLTGFAPPKSPAGGLGKRNKPKRMPQSPPAGDLGGVPE
jgi:hypothetical protein